MPVRYRDGTGPTGADRLRDNAAPAQTVQGFAAGGILARRIIRTHDMSRPTRLLLTALIAAALGACGQMGPLYMPEDQPPADTVPAPPSQARGHHQSPAVVS